jgi:hypothetical protein
MWKVRCGVDESAWAGVFTKTPLAHPVRISQSQQFTPHPRSKVRIFERDAVRCTQRRHLYYNCGIENTSIRLGSLLDAFCHLVATLPSYPDHSTIEVS